MNYLLRLIVFIPLLLAQCKSASVTEPQETTPVRTMNEQSSDPSLARRLPPPPSILGLIRQRLTVPADTYDGFFLEADLIYSTDYSDDPTMHRELYQYFVEGGCKVKLYNESNPRVPAKTIPVDPRLVARWNQAIKEIRENSYITPTGKTYKRVAALLTYRVTVLDKDFDARDNIRLVLDFPLVKVSPGQEGYPSGDLTIKSLGDETK
jgi:hypothetical protein